MAKLKVIQWATGTVGRHAMKAVTDLPHLELVGALAYDPAKAGRDAGEHCGAAPSGIAITTDREAIFAMEADCVLYMAQGEGKREQVLDDVCRLLESGKNVVSPAGPFFPTERYKAEFDRLQAACAEGGTSFHGCGVHPGS
jgi:hypothetical protein